MGIFGIGGAELVLVFIIMIVVAGPQRMIRWAYHLGRWTAQFRQAWEQMVDAVEGELKESGYDVTLPREMPNRNSLNQTARNVLKPYTDEIEKPLREAAAPVQATLNEVKQTGRDAQSAVQGKAKAIQPAPAASSDKTAASGADFGAWSGKPQTTEANGSDASPAKSANDFGAWSNPQHPSMNGQQQSEGLS